MTYVFKQGRMLMIWYLSRYSVDINFEKSAVNKDAFRDPGQRRKAIRDVKEKLEER